MWFPDNSKIEIRRTRCITGIDPFKFDQYRIYFYYDTNSDQDSNLQPQSQSQELLSCKEALIKSRFSSTEPYYYVRAYRV